MAEITTLVTCIGGGLSAQFIKLLKESRRHQIRVVGVDMSADPVARHFADTFETVPSGADPSYAETVAAVSRRHGVNLVFPCSDEEAIALAPHKEMFNSLGVTVACNDLDVLALITDKIATYRQLEKLGMGMPLWQEARDEEELLSALDGILESRGQAVIKNPRGRGGRGIFVIDPTLKAVERRPGSHELHMNRRSLVEQYVRELLSAGPLLVMERLVDPVCDLDVLAWRGEALTMVPRRRHSSTAPNEGHVLFEAPELEAIGRNVVHALDMSWLFDIDFMMNGAGEPIILEINPRASGSVSVGMSAGVPLMDDLISLVLGERPPVAQVPFGQRVYAYQTLGVR